MTSLRERVARAIYPCTDELWKDLADSVVEQVLLPRADAAIALVREEAARVADDFSVSDNPYKQRRAKTIANAIRSLGQD